MGETGTEVAKETAGMILTDDSFTSVAAELNRAEDLDNLRKGVTYYLALRQLCAGVSDAPRAGHSFTLCTNQISCWSYLWTCGFRYFCS